MSRPSVEAERRKQILSAASEVIASVGLQDLRLAHIAKVAGVSSGTIHYYFSTKRDVINAAFEFTMSKSLERREPILSSQKDPLATLEQLVDSYLPDDAVSSEAWRVWAELWAEGMRHEELQQVNEHLYGQWRLVIIEVIRAAQQQGSIKEGDPASFANMLIGMIDGLAIQVLLHSPDMTLEHMRDNCRALIALFTVEGNAALT